MRLIIMRHGESPSVVEAGVKSDEERPLSDKGRQDARQQAGRLAEKGYVPDLILASPLLRAQQTAHEVSRAFKVKPRVESFDGLANQLPGTELYRRLLADGPRPGLLMLIGHMPQLGELASVLTGGSLGFEPAALVVLEAAGLGRSRLVLSLPPCED